MVRLEINPFEKKISPQKDLHSSMVRLEIPTDETLGRPYYLFTFQYG